MTMLMDRKIKLSLGKIVLAEPGRILFNYRDEAVMESVYYVIAGMVRVEYFLPGDRQLRYYLQPGAVFGLAESIEGKIRISRAVTIEKTMLYRWDAQKFYLAANDTRSLAVLAIKSLSRLIRILNGEYSELLKLHRQEIETTSEERRLSGLELDLDSSFNESAHQHLRQTFHDKQVLIKEGTIQKQVYWILSGDVYITKQIKDSQKILATLGRGELIGEMSFFDRSLTSASVIAKGEVQAMVFTLRDFKEIFFTNPKWVKRLLVSLSDRVLFMIKKFQGVSKELGSGNA